MIIQLDKGCHSGTGSLLGHAGNQRKVRLSFAAVQTDAEAEFTYILQSLSEGGGSQPTYAPFM